MNFVAPLGQRSPGQPHPNPTLIKDVFYMTRDGKHLFLDPESPDWILLNANGAYILGLCDGTRSAEEIRRQISDPGGDPEYVAKVLSYADEHGLLERLQDSDGDHDCGSIGCATSALRPLRNVYIQMTNACNLACTYCYAQSGKSKGHLTDNELMSLFKTSRDMSPGVSFVLTGGEPLLNPFTLDYADEIKRAGNGVFLTTNGTPVTHKNVHRIAGLFERIRISIDGLDEQTNAATRGPGNHARVTEAIELLTAAGANLEVAVVVTKKNKHHLPGLVEKYDKRLRFQPLLMSGRQLEQDDIGLSPDEYYEVIKPYAQSLIGKHVSFMRRRGNNRCSAAEAGISIAENGDAYPCQIFHYPRFRGGNIKTDSLWDILQSEAFKRVRSLSVENLKVCNTCAIRKICGGSCRAYAYGETGEDDRPDSSCNFQKIATMDALFQAEDLVAC
jgi:radical SAM protein with 4Fe4S-binding SPASM domain